MRLIAQPGSTTVAALSAALTPTVSSIDIAVAYATFSGVKELLYRTPLAGLVAANKRFLVGIDWYRSEPAALATLARLPNSELHVVDGAYLVGAQNCQPRRTFHPKAYLVNDRTRTLLVGSANLSKNGLRNSIELSLQSSTGSALDAFDAWFTNEWRRATQWARIQARYSEQYIPAKKREYVVTEDDDVPDPAVLNLRWVTSERLRIVRAAQNLWVDVGHLHNRDLQGLPGTDLQFTQMTRIFFGAPATIVPGNSHLLDVELSMRGARSQARPMVFNDASSMDRLSLPVPGQAGWPARYDDETLLFTKSATGSFTVTMAGPGERATWRRQSQSTGLVIPMARNRREWGVF
jgi:HKD family nuclease